MSNILIGILGIILVINAVILYKILKKQSNSVVTEETYSKDIPDLSGTGFDVAAFRERMKNMRESTEIVDGCELYDIPTVIMQDDLSGVEIVTNEVELMLERKTRRA